MGNYSILNIALELIFIAEFQLNFKNKSNLNILISFRFADQQSENVTDKNVIVAKRHIIKSGDVNHRIEMDTNSSLQEANEANSMKPKCQESANCNGNDAIGMTANCQKVEADKTLQQNMAFEALEHTKLAVAQFTAATLSKGVNESSIKDLTMLQSALFTLQHQQVFQMQLIEQLQYQLAKTNARKDKKWKSSQSAPKNDEKDEKWESNHVAAEDESDFKSSSGEW